MFVQWAVRDMVFRLFRPGKQASGELPPEAASRGMGPMVAQCALARVFENDLFGNMSP